MRFSTSFIATAKSVLYAGAKPVFADIGGDFNISPELVEEKSTGETRALLPVHLYGQAADHERYHGNRWR